MVELTSFPSSSPAPAADLNAIKSAKGETGGEQEGKKIRVSHKSAEETSHEKDDWMPANNNRLNDLAADPLVDGYSLPPDPQTRGCKVTA